MKRTGAVFCTTLLVLAGCVTTKAPEEPPPAPPPDRSAAMEAVTEGRLALAHGLFAESSASFKEALRLDPGNDEAELGLAEVYLGFGAYGDALAAFEVLQDSPTVALEARQGLGITLLILGSLDEAYVALNETVAQAPHLWRAWNGLGRYHDLKGEWRKAETAFRNARATVPSTHAGEVRNNIGMLSMSRGRYRDAAKQFAAALDLDPNLEVAENNLRFALAFQGKYAEALSGSERTELPTTLNNVGYIALLRGDHAHAEAYFLRAMEASPTFHEVASENLQLLSSMRKINTAAARDLSQGDSAQ